MEPAGGCLKPKISAFLWVCDGVCGPLFLDSLGGFFVNRARGGE